VPGIDTLKYQKPRDLAAAADTAELLTVKLRYTPPEEKKSRLLEVPLRNRKPPFKEMSDDFRFAAAVASFGMLLAQSDYKGEATFADVLDWARAARGQDPAGRRAEVVRLVQAAARLHQ
jgi:Ca-activated chloride channel family protein